MGDMNATITKSTTALRWSAAIALLACLIGAFLYSGNRADRELRDLPKAERSALYVRTLDTLRGSCAHATGSVLSEYCREQAEFIKRFHECDRDCRELAESFVRKATR